jgi:hypothetical protein
MVENGTIKPFFFAKTVCIFPQKASSTTKYSYSIDKHFNFDFSWMFHNKMQWFNFYLVFLVKFEQIFPPIYTKPSPQSFDYA